MDFVDEAQIEELITIKYALMAPKKEKSLVPKGECYFCFEEVEGNKLFCNNICAGEYYKRNKLIGI